MLQSSCLYIPLSRTGPVTAPSCQVLTHLIKSKSLSRDAVWNSANAVRGFKMAGQSRIAQKQHCLSLLKGTWSGWHQFCLSARARPDLLPGCSASLRAFFEYGRIEGTPDEIRALTSTIGRIQYQLKCCLRNQMPSIEFAVRLVIHNGS